MECLDYQTDLLHLNTNLNFVLRRNCRIKGSRLPSDFFNGLPSVPSMPRQIGGDISNRDLKTPSFRCRSRYNSSLGDTIDQERKVETARTSLEKSDLQESQMFSQMSSSQKMRSGSCKPRALSKESMTVNLDEKHLRLPKILNRALLRRGWRS
jgi:hypothetical protein